MMHTQTITRRTIKRVETQLQGLGQWDWINQSAPVYAGNTSQTGISLQNVIDWLTGRTGELKVQATQFVEGFVRLMYAKEGACTVTPTSSPPAQPNADPQIYCAGTVSGMIERCRLSEARTLIENIKTQLYSRANGSGADAPYVKRWVDQYFVNDYPNLTSQITAAQSVCGAVGTLPKVCQEGYEWNFSRLQCVPKGSGGGIVGPGTGISTNTIMIIGAFALAAMFLMKR